MNIILLLLSLLLIAAKPVAPGFRISSGSNFIVLNLQGVPIKYSDKNGKFDDAGRITQLGDMIIFYDSKGRLTKINEINFSYDKEGLMVQLNKVKVDSVKKVFEGRLPNNVKAIDLNPRF